MRFISKIVKGIVGFILKITLIPAAFIAGVFCGAISGLLDELAIKNVVKKKCPVALRAVIEKKKRTAIYVGIFDINDNRIESTTIRSKRKVSESLFVGQEIYIYD